jgi:hypothetical protein
MCRLLQLGVRKHAPYIALLVCLGSLVHGGEEASRIEARLSDVARFLSDDRREGRGIGTTGLDAAADFIAAAFKDAGLKTELFDGGPFQKFRMTTGAERGSKNQLALVGPLDASQPKRLELKPGEDFNPLALSGSGSFDLPLVFVGYGITAKDENYDDYAGIDVKGKAVLILRHEPQQANPHSAFNGQRHSDHAPFVRKVSNAYEHGAAAVVFCTDRFDIDKTVADWERRWLAALDEVTEEHRKFKVIPSPDADQRRAYQQRVGKLLKTIRSYADQL